jgi:hypothetical protein
MDLLEEYAKSEIRIRALAKLTNEEKKILGL